MLRRARRRAASRSNSCRAATTDQLGLPPDRFGLVDHDAIGDAWERANGGVSIVALLLRAARGVDLPTTRVPAPRWAARGVVEAGGEPLAVDRPEREVDPAVLAGERLRQASRGKKPTWRVSSGWPTSSPPSIRQWNTSEYSGTRAKPRRRPSSTAISDTGSTSMPVSS